MNSKLLLVVVGLVAAVTAQAESNATLTVATYNLLQIPFAPVKQERLDAAIEFLQQPENQFDILCLQELYVPSERQQVLRGLKSDYPYQLYPAPRQNRCSATCSGQETGDIIACLAASPCGIGLTSQSTLSCFIDNCKTATENVTSECKNCVLGKGLTAADKARECGGVEDFNGNSDVLTSCQYVFDGESDPVLLSKYPFEVVDTIYYDVSPFASITALYARVRHPEFGKIHTACTHLIAQVPLLDLSEENEAEMQQLVEYLNAVVINKTETIIILGDLNTSPEKPPQVSMSFPKTYNFATRTAGYADVVSRLEAQNGTQYECTYCSSNSLANTKDNTALDHILVYKSARVKPTDVRIFGVERIVTVDGANSQNVTYEISDHYGLAATLVQSSTPIGITAGETSTAPFILPSMLLFSMLALFFGLLV